MAYRKKLLLFSIIVFAFLTGCNMKLGDGLLVKPKLPDEYNLLQKELDKVLSAGTLYYAVPETGTRQDVQLIDLDGDGEDEAVAFFRKPEGEIQFYVFKRGENSYDVVGFEEGVGRTLRGVYYPSGGQSGSRALAISWGMDENATSYGMTVYGLGDGGLVNLLDVQYANVTIHDINGDSADELIFIQRDGGADPSLSAAVYRLEGDAYRLQCRADMCKEARTVTNISFGKLDGNSAMYIDSRNKDNSFYVTDVISIQGESAINETIDSGGGGLVTWRTVSVFSSDIDGDGVIDVPTSAYFNAALVDTDMRNKLIWQDFSDGRAVKVAGTTFHSAANRWYLMWPDSWKDKILAETVRLANMTRTRFYLEGYNEPGDETDPSQSAVLFIYVFSGDNREDHLKLYSSMKRIRTTGSDIYCYSLPPDSPDGYKLTDEQIEKMFKLVETKWQTEVY